MSALQLTLCIGDRIKPLPADYDIECLTSAAGVVFTCKVTNRVDGQIMGCRKVIKSAPNLRNLYQVRLASLRKSSLTGNSLQT